MTHSGEHGHPTAEECWTFSGRPNVCENRDPAHVCVLVPTRNRLAEAFIRGFQAGAERPDDSGDGDAMYQAFREWQGASQAATSGRTETPK